MFKSNPPKTGKRLFPDLLTLLPAGTPNIFCVANDQIDFQYSVISVVH